jgi:hypothetical protein
VQQQRLDEGLGAGLLPQGAAGGVPNAGVPA